MNLSITEQLILEAAAACGEKAPAGFCTCDKPLRRVVEQMGKMTDAADTALCVAGDEDEFVFRLYKELISLVERGLLFGHGDFRTPAGPRYTDCRITANGKEALAAAKERSKPSQSNT